ncbi:unnamed protein product [Clonostachys rhizophaga]|uniref:Beta-xylosidase C-terminal Concanavalin A-like domain-containing protein n=1 Tax=Clonostachys rhizophaga TaxID=160324 RepID=A0A9N9YJC3_9HYPO|nr:unnamed protein product [Clonostachys rhizophaga]CAH0020021.1 unnamed protein product [Clonostachys rhizophaga]CAH0020125.1 unnamed protein product [Clonostachys rhizophaga]CAH0026943.1 unnamed protein product [Clonostachys rhizophaga]
MDAQPGASTQLAQFCNPVRWEDLPDPEVIRVGDRYYMSTSTFHFSLGASVLESNNLVDWAYVGHSVPELPGGPSFSLDTGNNKWHTGYGKGVWASSLKYRESDGLFYFYTTIQGTNQTYLYTAKNPGDTWTPHPPLNKIYYDVGLLIDDDDTLYLAYGAKSIEVAQLSADGLTEVVSQQAVTNDCLIEPVYTSDEYLAPGEFFEGARMYKIDGVYYIWITKTGNCQYVLRSSDGPFGPYEARDVIVNMRSPIPGSGAPHQGALIDTPQGDWYYMAFVDAWPAGRIPVLAPVKFDEAKWPRVVADFSDARGQWLGQYPKPAKISSKEYCGTCFKRHTFAEAKLDSCWEWNHNPDNSKWRLQDGILTLDTASVTQSLHYATNTLTHRSIGPGSSITVCLDTSKLINGDRAGVSLFRDESTYIGIHKDDNAARIVIFDGARVGPMRIPVGWINGCPTALDWKWIANGSITSETSLDHDKIWLRAKADFRPVFCDESKKQTRQAMFEYSYDGLTFTQLGPAHTLTKSIVGFVGLRFGLFNFATNKLGGQLLVEDCNIELWNPQSE